MRQLLAKDILIIGNHKISSVRWLLFLYEILFDKTAVKLSQYLVNFCIFPFGEKNKYSKSERIFYLPIFCIF